MNNIYKVIWSKAKNCYVVASEIARSHTKSASGSEKIGGGTRRKLLASLMVLSLLCGGLGVAEASVHVDETGGVNEVYTTTEVNAALDKKADKTAVEDIKKTVGDVESGLVKKTNDNATGIEVNRTNINALKDTVGDDTKGLTKKINDNTAAIANKADTAALAGKADKDEVTTALEGKANKADVYSKTGADDKFATKDALDNKADQTYVDNAVAGAITTAGNNVETKLASYATTAYVDGKIANEENARENAITAAIAQERNDRDAAIGLEATNRDVAITNAKTDLQGKINEEKTARENFDAALDTRLTTAEGKIGDNKTAIDALKAKDTALEGEITRLDGSGVKYDSDVKDKITLKGADGTTITRLKDATLSDSSTDAVTGKQLYKTNESLAAEKAAREDKDNELDGKIATLDGKVTTAQGDIQTNADNIKKNKDDIAATNKRTAGIKRDDVRKETTIENYVTVDSLGNVKAKGNVTADGKLKGNGVDAGTGDITTDGAVNAGSLKVENASNLKGDVTMDKKLSVTGDTSLGKTDVGGALNVTGESNLQGNVILGKNTANTVTVNGKSDFKEAVEMDKGLTVTSGDTTLKGKLTVTDDAELKNTTVGGTLGVTGATTLSGELTAEKNATFEKDVTVKGTTNLKDTNVDGNLKVTGTITTDKMIFGDKAHNNYTEIDQGKVTSKNSVVNGEGQLITSSSIFNAEENKVGFANNATGDQSFHKQTSDIIMDNVKDRDNSNNRTQTKTETKDIITDKDGNSSTTSQTASENKTYLKDKDGKNTNSTIDTAKGYDKTIKGENGETSTKQDELNITNTAQNGTITNDAQNIVNNASGNITNKANTMDTNVTGKATESYGSLDTTVNGNETHIVKGTKTETVDGKVTENYKAGQETNVTGNQDIHVTGKQTNTVEGGQENIISGGQINKITGDQTTIVTNGNISNKATKITNEATDTLTDKVSDNTRVTTSTSITDTVGTANRKIENGKIIDTANDSTVTTENGKGTTFAKNGSAAFSTDAGAPTNTNIAGNQITTGCVDANELGVSDKDGANTADLSVKAGEGVKASASNGTITGSLDVTAEEVGSSVTDASGKGSTFKQRIDAIMMESKNVSINAEETLTNEAKDIVTNASNSITEKVGETNVTTKTTTSSKSEIQNADTITSVQQTEDMVQSFVGKKDFSVTNVTTNFANASANQVTENGQTSTVLNNKDGLLIQNNANGNSFTTADGTNTGPALEWTNIKGNEISTGKVEANYVKMGYADVMKDLGVHGNAKVDKNLEVGGTSTLKGDVTMESNATVEKDLTVKGTTNLKNTNVDGNLDVTGNAAIHGNQTIDGTLKVTKKATFEDSVSIAKDLSVVGDVTANSYKVGGNTYIDANGINANNQKITNVADGSISEGSKDAVNGGQLYGVKRDLEHQVDKVGANAAAMANLRPMEFDPSSKWNIAAAIGNYGSETAAALGAFYRPNDNVMVNLSTAFGTGENMVGGGVSVRLGKGGNKLSREESNALKAQVNDLTARMDALLSVLNPNMSKDFPDVPENHWAYEAVSRLAGNDIVQGYPDGEFHGERTMTRYEMAEIIYNALSRGAEAERELVEEFKPELQAMAASEKATAEKAEG